MSVTISTTSKTVPGILIESENEVTQETYAKQQLGASERAEGKLLGLLWDEKIDELSVRALTERASTTKRGILAKLARIYDPLGLAAPVTLGGKVIYRDVCSEKRTWDTKLSDESASRWLKWESGLPVKLTLPRALTRFHEPVEEIALRAFGDASGVGVAAAVHAMVQQPSGQSQGLITAKACLSKKGLTIPRLELVSCACGCESNAKRVGSNRRLPCDNSTLLVG